MRQTATSNPALIDGHRPHDIILCEECDRGVKATTAYGGIPCCSLCFARLKRECNAISEVAKLRTVAARNIAAASSTPASQAEAKAIAAAEEKRLRTGKLIFFAVLPPIEAVATPEPVPYVSPDPEPTPEPVAPPEPTSPPRRNVAAFRLRPDADAHPELCRIDGCDRKPETRGLCSTDMVNSMRHGKLNAFGLPPVPRSIRKPRAAVPDSRPSRVVAMVEASPGIHRDDCAAALGIPTYEASKIVGILRKKGRIAATNLSLNHPNFYYLHPVDHAQR
jgi:hypothetical protein